MTTPSAEAKQLPEVERFKVIPNGASPALSPFISPGIELVLASTFDAHTTALKDEIDEALGIAGDACEENAALKEAVRVLREALNELVRNSRTYERDNGFTDRIVDEDDYERASQALADTAQWEK